MSVSGDYYKGLGIVNVVKINFKNTFQKIILPVSAYL